MRNYSQIQKSTEQAKSVNASKSGQPVFTQNHAINSISRLPRAVGNQAVQLLLDAGPENREGESESFTKDRFGRKPGRISAYFNLPVKPQAEQRGRELKPLEPLQIKRTVVQGTGKTEAPPVVRQVLNSPGQPLDPGTRAFFEPRFGHSFSAVRVHSGPEATAAARSVGAQAFAAGSRIVFGEGRFVPQDPASRRLLAHELTHTVQQGAAAPLPQTPCEPRSTRTPPAPPTIQRRTLGIAGACWFSNCTSQLENFFMIPEDGPPGFHPSGTGTFRVDDIDGLWFKYHTPKNEWFKIPDVATGQVTCTDDERAPSIRSAVVAPFVTAGWSSDAIHTPNPY